MYIVTLFNAPDAVVAEFRNPVTSSLFGSLTIALLLLAAGILPYAPLLALAIWSLRIIHGRMAIGDFDVPPALQRCEHHGQVGGAVALIFIIVSFWLARLGLDRHTPSRQSVASRFRPRRPLDGPDRAACDRPPARLPWRRRTVNRHANGTPYRRAKGTPFVAYWMKPMMFLCSADRGRFFVPA